MEFEKTSGPLRKLGERLFDLMEQLGGAPPLPNKGGWYRTVPKARVWLRFIGEKARKYPKNSVHLSAQWDEHLDVLGAQEQNNFFSPATPSADFFARSDDPEGMARAEDFIRRAYDLDRPS